MIFRFSSLILFSGIQLFCVGLFAQTISFAAVGDVFLGRAGRDYGGDDPFRYVSGILNDSDVVLGNLETPIAEIRKRNLKLPCSLKRGTCLTDEDKRYRRLYLLTFNARLKAPAILKNAGFTLLSTANNHSEDQGSNAMIETMERLKAAGLQSVGTASSRDDAFKPVIIEKNGVKVAFFSATTVINFVSKSSSAFVAYSSLNDLIKNLPGKVAEVKKEVDFVVVTLHYSAENSVKATTGERKLMTLLDDAGANLFIGTHQHVLGGVEIFKNMVAVYSLGNFLFDKSDDLWGKTAILKLDFVKSKSGNSLKNVHLIPVILNGKPYGLPKPAEGTDGHKLLKRVISLSHLYQNPKGALQIKNGVLKIKTE
ncbi:MAG: CapA family protein [Deltaproteobacteria bacterium]|nr:CapA family protein [Deltaproteobacteria bacterium]